MFNGQFRFSENLMYEKIFAKIILPIVYNGLSATIFCVTRKIVHIAASYYQSGPDW